MKKETHRSIGENIRILERNVRKRIKEEISPENLAPGEYDVAYMDFDYEEKLIKYTFWYNKWQGFNYPDQYQNWQKEDGEISIRKEDTEKELVRRYKIFFEKTSKEYDDITWKPSTRKVRTNHKGISLEGIITSRKTLTSTGGGLYRPSFTRVVQSKIVNLSTPLQREICYNDTKLGDEQLLVAVYEDTLREIKDKEEEKRKIAELNKILEDKLNQGGEEQK